MDPDETLRTARQAVATIRRHSRDEHTDETEEAVVDLADAFAALDQWLTNGGFAPAAWAPRPTRTP